ncbi:hypothetical protein BDZ89DRAFT_178307 [Hymenopellis radicata]|nr:hypothetical protein BDZ89DRAFT_178307 [Hymenopellis radicata]
MMSGTCFIGAIQGRGNPLRDGYGGLDFCLLRQPRRRTGTGRRRLRMDVSFPGAISSSVTLKDRVDRTFARAYTRAQCWPGTGRGRSGTQFRRGRPTRKKSKAKQFSTRYSCGLACTNPPQKTILSHVHICGGRDCDAYVDMYRGQHRADSDSAPSNASESSSGQSEGDW